MSNWVWWSDRQTAACGWDLGTLLRPGLSADGARSLANAGLWSLKSDEGGQGFVPVKINSRAILWSRRPDGVFSLKVVDRNWPAGNVGTK